jgi:hypothetical protein
MEGGWLPSTLAKNSKEDHDLSTPAPILAHPFQQHPGCRLSVIWWDVGGQFLIQPHSCHHQSLPDP